MIPQPLSTETIILQVFAESMWWDAIVRVWMRMHWEIDLVDWLDLLP